MVRNLPLATTMTASRAIQSWSLPLSRAARVRANQAFMRRSAMWYTAPRSMRLIIVCFLRESAEKPMRECFEYSDEWCDLTTAACGTAMRCYKRHKEPIPLTALRPPVRFALVDVSPRASRSDAAAATGGGRERPPKLKIWCVPSGARQEALLAITKDRLDGLDVQ